ncbi:dnaJ homolog subfamily C member 13-like [Sinocyclocheilus anshuiensis]|uniref:dnaJ homolog subfamily C member 13-like n=2 Tax=Sinocyclocheilus anshuiensis TaxID=1608454 RepID=UPI0007B9B26F|nr:PREDICTED: dnaJ homolog subfamily C member 13-like [Sinocyclocheilus anshuiensis]
MFPLYLQPRPCLKMNVLKDNKDLACFYTTKHSWRGKYKRVFSVGTHGITTYNPTTLEVTNQRYNCFKHHWSDARRSVCLEVTPGGIDQIDPQSNRVICSYDYRCVEGFAELSDYQGGFCVLYGGFGRLHLFASEHRDEIIRSAIEHAGSFIGITLRLRKELLSFEGFLGERLGKYGSDECITSLTEFIVQKITPRHTEPVRRILALTETCLVERDPASYNIVTLKPFGEVFALICDADNPQVFTVEFIRGQIRKYCSTERDSLLASLLDSVRASGNRDVCVKMAPTHRGQRWGLLSMPVDEEVESLHLRFLAAPPNCNFADAVFRFNSNISYSGVIHAVTQDGLFSENKEKLISNAILALLSQDVELPGPNSELEAQFLWIILWACCRFREKLGVKTVKALKRNHNGVTHAAIDMLCALMFMYLVLLSQHPSMAIVKGAGLIMKAIIEEGDKEIASKMQELALSEGALPRHLHTSMFTISADQRMLTNRQLSRHLVGLWTAENSTALNLLKRILPTGLLAYLDSSDPVPEKDMDRMHIRDNVKIATDQFGRNKVPEWQRIAGKAAKEVEKFAKEKADIVLLHWRDKMGIAQKENANQRPVILRKRRQRIKIESNWELFYYKFQLDHARSNLIWNLKTREELRDALEAEMRSFGVDRELGSASVVSWNHQEFEVKYECLSDEIKIGDYYLRLLLEEDESEESGAIKRSYEFFNELYHRFLLTPKVAMKCLCLQALTIVYGKCCEEIGPFADTKYIVGMLDRCTEKLERDRLILFLNKLILNKKNVKDMMDSNGVRILVDLLTLAHLHTNRATVPLQSNVLEASPDMKRESEKEWYFGNADKERRGPFGFEEMQEFWSTGTLTAKTRCWAQGMDGWRPLQAIPQLKWSLLAAGQAVMNETDLATLILNMLITMCSYFPSRDQDNAIIRPLPKVKRLISDSTCLPHIVQLLLTFDPILVEKVANLLYLVMQDNPNLQRLYLTGVFFFIMMYTGSNVLPVARLLKYTHLKQAFKSEEAKGQDIVQRSVLGSMLPEAMVCYLENYEAERFSEIFLGEFDTPEAIWSSEMRRLMIEKIAAHLADFSPRLQSNTRALYQYCPIPVVSFPQLDNELFCNIYYLRHLCDSSRFPDWSIRDPVKLLKDTLDAWKREVEKKPPSMSVDDAYEVLNLPKGQGQHDESKIRKAYFRLAQKYHPDKNPEGRDMFEKVNKAYEFLCTKSARIVDGPDPENIILILKAQSILFNRHKQELEPYKYAGYPMLIKTITMETGDGQLFSKTSALLPAAAELAFHTVNCSALNAEELRRENGIEVLMEALSRCVSVLTASSRPEDMAVQVCGHVCRCYSVAAQFEECREKIVELPNIIRDVCHILYYSKRLISFSLSSELEPYKYAGYPMLIKTITMETGDGQLFSKTSALLPAAAELAFHTVNCSALNAEELRRENGIEVLMEALSRCVSVLTASSRPEDMAVQVCGHVCRCYSVAAQFEECREKIVELPNIIRDVCHILYYSKNTTIFSSFAVDFFLQTHLYRAGVLWHLLFTLFSYDYTLEESGVQASHDTNQQQVCNSLAKLSVGALGRLAGYSGARGPEDQPSGGELPPENPSIRKSLGAMLTPYISRRLSRNSPAEVLKLLNSNSETPYLIWNNGTRAELMEFLEEQQESNIKRGECDTSFGSEFLFSEHGKELIVGEIFVRVYNEQPAFPLEYPKAFASSLLDYVGSQAQYLHTLLAMTQTNKVESQQHAQRLRWAEMALEALRNVIKNNPGSETECIGHFKLLFSLLRVHGAGRVQQLALEVVNTVTSNQDCVVNIAESLVLPNLLVLLHSLPSSRQLVLETLYALTSNTKIITEAMNRGALIYLLDLFCNSTHPQVRTQTAELFSKMTSDKLVGPKVRLTLMRFLPAVFMDAMRDNPEAAVHIFEGTHENPELIWNDSSRETVSTSVREMMLEHFKQQKDNPEVSWKLAEDFSVAYGAGQGELEVGGVFLRIFISQPGWVLRKPREFLVSLMDTLTALLEKNSPNGEALETVSTAAVCLFSSQTQLADQVPPLGHLPRVLTALNHKNNAVPKSAIRLIHVLSDNELCVRSMAALDTIGPLMTGMKLRADMAGLACEALNRMFQREQTELVAQALRVDLVPYLLKLLEGVGLETLENPSATKAQIVKALKSMTRSLQFGEQVNEILSRSTVWSAFKDQKHDLFISDSQTAGYLTGPGVAGYLTAGSGSTVMPSVPPPVDNDTGDLG